MININKLFPRLSIRVKLAIAFALVALAPLAAVSAIGARETLAQIRAKVRNSLEHDLEMADALTAQSLNSAENHVELIAEAVLGPLLRAGEPSANKWVEAKRVVESLVATEPTLYQVKLVDAEGRYRLFVRSAAAGHVTAPDEGGESYAWRAATLKPRTRVLLDVEVSGPEESGSRPMPAVAILVPLHGPRGDFIGAVVGETYAAALFTHLEHASPEFTGVTGLVDSAGHFLYHSVRKRDWATLLAARERVTLASDFPASVAASITSGRPGTVVSTRSQFVSFRPLTLGSPLRAPLFLYRVVPFATLARPARSFLVSVLLAALLVTLIVLGIAVIAADQFTKPIFRIRDAAWQLARTETVPPLDVTTNDEFEDLAHDFSLVARQVAEHRAQREETIAERTRVLERTHAELTDILEHSADGIILLDEAGVVSVWNHGAERLFGHASEEAVGAPIDTLLRPSDERAARERGVLRRELGREGVVVNFRTEVLARDGTPIQITLTQTLITGPDGRALGSSLIVRDNRLQSRLEDQMRRSERLSAINVMAAGLAHEINNPLAIIGNRIEVMQRDIRDRRTDGALAADADVLQAHVARLRELTSSLLRFARDDQLDATSMALDAIAENTVTLLRRTMATRRLDLELQLEPGVPKVPGYEKAIETVIVNLLLNSADATPPGGTITLGIRRSADGEAVEIEVRDTGPGIAPALRERIFEPFFTTKDAGHGTGLGLTVCRSIVDRHGGSIRVDENAGGGCRFVVSLPLHPVGMTWNSPAFS